MDKFKRYDVNLGISLDRDILFGDYANFCSMKKESSWFLLHMNQFIHLHDSSYFTSLLLALIVQRNEFIARILEFCVFNWSSIKIESTYSNENLIFPICSKIVNLSLINWDK